MILLYQINKIDEGTLQIKRIAVYLARKEDIID